jgi:hypothetical protein
LGFGQKETTRKIENHSWFLLHDNAPAHRSVLVEVFLTKNNVTTLEQFPHSPELASGNFYLFYRLKLALKGRRFCDATDIIKNAKEQLKKLS